MIELSRREVALMSLVFMLDISPERFKENDTHYFNYFLQTLKDISNEPSERLKSLMESKIIDLFCDGLNQHQEKHNREIEKHMTSKIWDRT